MEILKVEHLSKTYGTGEAKVEALKGRRPSLFRKESSPQWSGNRALERVPF